MGGQRDVRGVAVVEEAVRPKGIVRLPSVCPQLSQHGQHNQRSRCLVATVVTVCSGMLSIFRLGLLSHSAVFLLSEQSLALERVLFVCDGGRSLVCFLSLAFLNLCGILRYGDRRESQDRDSGMCG